MDTTTEERSKDDEQTGIVPIHVLDFFLLLNLFWEEVVDIFGLAANLLGLTCTNRIWRHARLLPHLLRHGDREFQRQ